VTIRDAYTNNSEGTTMADVTKQLSEGFILTVGITPPSKGRELTAGRYITGMLALTVAGAAAMFAFILSRVL